MAGSHRRNGRGEGLEDGSGVRTTCVYGQLPGPGEGHVEDEASEVAALGEGSTDGGVSGAEDHAHVDGEVRHQTRVGGKAEKFGDSWGIRWCGKSAYAESEGNPIVMNSGWCLKSIFPGATHIVVNDVKPAMFGYAGKSHWRDVLGGQERFNCRDFQQETRTVEWGLPCVWTCNFDNDPRKDRGVAEYMSKVSVVVEIRDRPGERGWGKLYESGNR